MAYGRHTWLIFLAAVVAAPSAFVVASCKSIISKLVGEDELGRAFSLVSCGESAAALAGSMLFTAVYAATVSVMPGLAFLLDSALMAALLCVHLVVAHRMTKSSSSSSSAQLTSTATTHYGTSGEMRSTLDLDDAADAATTHYGTSGEMTSTLDLDDAADAVDTDPIVHSTTTD